MKKYIALLLAVLCAFALVAQDKRITAAADPWPPFIDPDNKSQGLSMEILRAALATQGYQVDLQVIPWARAEAGVKSGSIDVLPDTWMTEDRKKDLLFSEPYAANEIRFIKKKGDPFEFTGLESLTGKTVGTVRGYGYGDAFLKAVNFKRDEGNDFVTNIRKLLAGRFPLTLEDMLVATDILKKADPKLLDGIEFTKNSLSVNKLYVTVGLKNPKGAAIIEAFNKGLVEIRANGKLAGIFAAYGLK